MSTEEKARTDTRLEDLAERLSGSSRRERMAAATEFAAIAQDDPSVLLPYVPALIDALNRPEAQTRWEVLEAMSSAVTLDPQLFVGALDDLDTALFDEENGFVRLGALRFLCRLGAVGEDYSDRTWPLIDEAIQCYHGDVEFQDMLDAVVEFSTGSLSPDVRKALASRMKFDAENAKGYIGRKAVIIVANTTKG